MSKTDSKHSIHTACIHAGASIDRETGAVSIPIYQSSTFAFTDAQQGADRFAGRCDGFIYTRLGNPTICALEDAVSELEGGFRGIATSSGMAAVNTLYFSLLNKGDHIISTEALYGPSRILMEKEYARFGVEADFVDTSDSEAVKKAWKKNTKLVYVETPANPTIKCTDIKKMAAIAHDNGALVAVDNTFATPVLQRPLSLGADIVIHSMTKFINGHTDVVSGMVVPKTEELWKRLRPVFNNLGGCMDPHQAWLVHRGIKTLSMRVERSQANAQKLAEFLENHPMVEWVRYPGLESHPQRDLIRSQMKGPGSLMSFEVKGGIGAGKALLDNVRLAVLAVSLGGIETLIQHPASMTHAGMSPESRQESGITDGLIRISVGCEEYEDIEKDIIQGLEASKKAAG